MANADQGAEARQMPDMWWCVQSGRQDGPMSLDALKVKLRDVDTREVFVWRGGFKDWKRVEDVAELTPPRPQEPPPFRAEAHKRKPIPSNTPSVRIAATLAGGAVAVLVFMLAAFGPASLLDASAVLPHWSDKTVANFLIWSALGLAFAAFYGVKQYVERKSSDTGENRLDPTSKTAEESWGQRLAEIADEKHRLSDTGENRFGSQPRKSEEPPTPRAPQARQRAAEERLKREAEEQRDARVTWSESLKAEFPKESPSHEYRYQIEEDGSITAINAQGRRVAFRNWASFSDADNDLLKKREQQEVAAQRQAGPWRKEPDSFGSAKPPTLTAFCKKLSEPNGLLRVANNMAVDRSVKINKRALLLSYLVMGAAGNVVAQLDRGLNGDSTLRFLEDTNLDVVTAEAIIWNHALLMWLWKTERKKNPKMLEGVDDSIFIEALKMILETIAAETGFDFKEGAIEREKLYYEAINERSVPESFATVLAQSLGRQSLAEPLETVDPLSFSPAKWVPLNLQLSAFFSTMPKAYYESFKNFLKEWPTTERFLTT
jgi:hypothetical protein